MKRKSGDLLEMGELGILRVRGGWFYLFTGKTAVTALRVVTVVFILRFHSVGGGGTQAVPSPPYLFHTFGGQ